MSRAKQRKKMIRKPTPQVNTYRYKTTTTTTSSSEYLYEKQQQQQQQQQQPIDDSSIISVFIKMFSLFVSSFLHRYNIHFNFSSTIWIIIFLLLLIFIVRVSSLLTFNKPLELKQQIQQIEQPSYIRRIRQQLNNTKIDVTTNERYNNHSIAIIVAYRDLYKEQKRSEQLNKFIPHMIQFLNKGIQQNKLYDYHIYIIDQSNTDGLKFNRGKLMNVGFDYAMTNNTTSTSTSNNIQKHDIFIFHDVDLLPNDNMIDWYTMYPSRPIHLAHPWPKYENFTESAGGIISLNANDFIQINGFPNNFWGWGGEDNELISRLRQVNNAKLIDATNGTFIDVENETIQEKVVLLQKHNNWRNHCLLGLLVEHSYTWKTNGLTDLYYATNIVSIQSLDPISKKATKITTNLGLNQNHWTNAVAYENATYFSLYDMVYDRINDIYLSYFSN